MTTAVVALLVALCVVDIVCAPPDYARVKLEMLVDPWLPALNFMIVKEFRVWGWERTYSDLEGLDQITLGAGVFFQICWLTPTNDPFYEPPTDPRS